jgi:lipopolysaccharide export system protein LptA
VSTAAGEYTRKASAASKERRWTVRWKSSELHYEEGRAYGTMRDVTGTIFEDDQPVSDFSGDSAVSRRDSSVLSLEGNVKVLSRGLEVKPGPKNVLSATKATLTCDVLEWHGDQKLIIAKGNVRVDSMGYEFGTAPVLLSSADLSEVATPKMYAKNNMDVKTKLAATIAAAAALAGAQQANLILRGKDGNLEIRNATNFNLKIDPSNPNARTFHATGSPVHGVIASQRMTAEANDVSGKALSVNRSLMLETATLTGDVKIVATRPSKITGASQEQTITLETPKAIYTRDLEKVTFDGKVVLLQSDPAASQSFRISGSSGNLVLYPPGDATNAKRAIRSLRLEGPVNFQLKSRREVEEGTPPVKKWLPFTVDGKAQEMTYDDSTRKLVLNIGVDVSADDPLYPFNSTARKMTITLDEQWNPVEIQGEGEPGRTVATPRPPRGKK